MDPDNKEKKSVPVVETFTDDMAKVIEDSQGGLIKKIIEEQEKKELQQKKLSPESQRNKMFVLVGSVLLLLSLALIIFLFSRKNLGAIPVNIPPAQSAPIIFTDKSKPEEIGGLSKEVLTQNISQEAQNPDVKQGDIERIYLTENGKPIGLRRFITLLKSSFYPSEPNFVSDNFLMGVVNKRTQSAETEPTGSLFILLKIRSFVDIFPLMRYWEDKMFTDLHGLFGIDINSTTSDLLTKNFEDGVIVNKNARILYADDGTIALMYVFADDQSLVIANDIDAVHEVILRLGGSQIKK